MHQSVSIEANRKGVFVRLKTLFDYFLKSNQFRRRRQKSLRDLCLQIFETQTTFFFFLILLAQTFLDNSGKELVKTGDPRRPLKVRAHRETLWPLRNAQLRNGGTREGGNNTFVEGE